MESARLERRFPVVAGVNLGLVAVLLVLAAIGWAVTDERMRGMDAGPGTDPGTLGFFIVAWVVMMAAMMFPSIWPMVSVHSRLQQSRRERHGTRTRGATALFVAGYLVTWSAAGVLGYTIFEATQALSIGALSWDRGGPYLAGGVILAAAVYQLTPLKDVCLQKCRGPVMFLMEAWRAGRLGALRMGIVHGAWCVGCCWALMAALFALGVMSVGWMVLIAALIAIEKLLPWKEAANRGVAILLAALAIGVAFAPEDVPGLVLPGSAAAHGMHGMEMEGPGREHSPASGHDMKGPGREHSPASGHDMKGPGREQAPASGHGMEGPRRGEPGKARPEGP